ncbi:MAG: competence/damage-inducible protein A [Bacteroidetes bacterium]|nr:competence/damage-inducible protein A [Bacteroidota bacterium]
MFAEIISIGDEILIGQITNSNAQWMAQQLNLIGISVKQISTVGDNREDVIRIFSEALQRADIILITGGLGPTNDDITKQCLCDFFKTKLVFNEQCFEDVKKMFSDRNLGMPAINKGQAELPENCIPIRNKNGTAPGMWFEAPPQPSPLGREKNQQQVLPNGEDIGGALFVSLPGVPYEMKAMMSDFVIPELQKRFQRNFIVHKTVHTQGIGESALAEKIKEWEDSLAKHEIKLAYLPSPGQVKLRVSLNGNDQKKITDLVDEKINELRQLIPEYIFATEEFGKEPETLEKVIGEILRKKKKTLAVAESCTGGYIAHLITSIAGSSDYFNGGIIAYANEMKINVLKVDVKILEEKGAVCKDVAEQMSDGVRKRLKADFGISTTGIAGPTGGSAEKPVGTVWISVTSDTEIISEKFNFGNNRERNIRRASLSALNMLRTLLEKHS